MSFTGFSQLGYYFSILIKAASLNTASKESSLAIAKFCCFSDYIKLAECKYSNSTLFSNHSIIEV